MINKLKALLVVATNWSDPSETIHAQNELLDSLPELLTRLEKLEAVAKHSALLLPHMRPYAEESICGDLELALAALDAVEGE